MEYEKEKLERCTGGTRAIPTLRRVLANPHLPTAGKHSRLPRTFHLMEGKTLYLYLSCSNQNSYQLELNVSLEV